MDEAARKVLGRLEAQCSKREYSSSDVMEKAMKALEGNRDAALEVVESLLKDRYVDDLRYAEAFSREKSALTGWGPIKIRFALRAKRIDDRTIESALERIDTDRANDKLRGLMCTKWKSLAGDPQAKLKLIRFTLSRGYDYSAVAPLAESISRDPSLLR